MECRVLVQGSSISVNFFLTFVTNMNIHKQYLKRAPQSVSSKITVI